MNAFLPILLAANKYRIINYDFPDIPLGSMKIPAVPLIILALVVGSIVAGILIAKAVRMRDYGWKVGLVLSTITVSTFIVLFG